MATVRQAIRSEFLQLSQVLKGWGIESPDRQSVRSQLLTSEDLKIASGELGLPSRLCQFGVDAERALRLGRALLQPEGAMEFLVPMPAFGAISAANGRFSRNPLPPMVKAVSFPKDGREVRLTADSFWMLDLFSCGAAYGDIVSDRSLFQLVDTGIYQAIRSFGTEVDLVGLMRSGELPEWMLQVMKRESMIADNLLMRRRYLETLTTFLGFPKAVDGSELILRPDFRRYLPSIGRPEEVFPGLVCAEEASLRAEGVTGYFGPVREEIAFAPTVQRLHRSVDRQPTPYVYYARPSLPRLAFDASPDEVKRMLVDSFRSEVMLGHARDMLIKVRYVTPNETAKAIQVVDAVTGFLNEVQRAL